MKVVLLVVVIFMTLFGVFAVFPLALRLADRDGWWWFPLYVCIGVALVVLQFMIPAVAAAFLFGATP